MLVQLKVMEDSSSAAVSAIKSESDQQQTSAKEGNTARECWNCGRRHEFHKRELCPAYGKTCNKCRKPNHFAAKCRSKSNTKSVKSVDDNEIYQAQVCGTNTDDSQFVTLKLESGNFLRFQVETGVQCNVVPLDLYKKATKDHHLTSVMPSKHTITAYGGTSILIVGKTLLRVWWGDTSCRLNCKIVDQSNIRPLLGRKACIGMKILSYLDNDLMNKPDTGGSNVYTLSTGCPLTKEKLVSKYPNVFGEGVGRVEGEYLIRHNPQIDQVQHAPKQIPVALRDQL